MTLSRHILVLALASAFAMGTLIPTGDARAQTQCTKDCQQRHQKFVDRCMRKAEKKKNAEKRQKAIEKCRKKFKNKWTRCYNKRCVYKCSKWEPIYPDNMDCKPAYRRGSSCCVMIKF